MALSSSPAVAHSVLATTSPNWSGYAVQSNLNTPANNVVTAVSGAWTVPAVTGLPGATAYSSIWVGIDGYSSFTVEQIGTDSDWSNGAPDYYAWYEMYPNNYVTITKLTVHPYDNLSASVTFTAGEYVLRITDATTKQSFSTVQNVAGAERSSAEWIVEAPSSGFGILSLADFGTATFRNATATFTRGGKSYTGAIDNPNWQSAAINLVTPGNAVNASTGALSDSAGKSSFSVVYVATPTSASSQHQWWQSTNAGDGSPLTIAEDGHASPSPANMANTNALAAVRTVPVGVPTAPNATHTPSPMSFRTNGDEEMNVPPSSIQAPNREAPLTIVPPAPLECAATSVEPAAVSTDATVSMTPETPSERREQWTGGLGKSLLAVFGVVGILGLPRRGFVAGKANGLDKRTANSLPCEDTNP